MKITQITVTVEDYCLRMTADFDDRCVNVEVQQNGDGDRWYYVCCCLFKHGPSQMAEEILLTLCETGELANLSSEMQNDYLQLRLLLDHWLIRPIVTTGLTA